MIQSKHPGQCVTRLCEFVGKDNRKWIYFPPNVGSPRHISLSNTSSSTERVSVLPFLSFPSFLDCERSSPLIKSLHSVALLMKMTIETLLNNSRV